MPRLAGRITEGRQRVDGTLGAEPLPLVGVTVTGEKMAVAIDESGGVLDESNWQEGFGWIELSIECCRCSRKEKAWLSFETM